jgi:hypothetical protein
MCSLLKVVAYLATSPAGMTLADVGMASKPMPDTSAWAHKNKASNVSDHSMNESSPSCLRLWRDGKIEEWAMNEAIG